MLNGPTVGRKKMTEKVKERKDKRWEGNGWEEKIKRKKEGDDRRKRKEVFWREEKCKCIVIECLEILKMTRRRFPAGNDRKKFA